jgi:hypothetical protein
MATKTVKKAQAAYEKTKKTNEPGEGGRFRAMKRLGKAKGVKDPEAWAAWIGRKKYGAGKMAKMAAAGKKS